MQKDCSWMLAFMKDLRDVARDKGHVELARDLDSVIARHRSVLAAGSRPTGSAETSEKASNVVVLPSRRA